MCSPLTQGIAERNFRKRVGSKRIAAVKLFQIWLCSHYAG